MLIKGRHSVDPPRQWFLEDDPTAETFIVMLFAAALIRASCMLWRAVHVSFRRMEAGKNAAAGQASRPVLLSSMADYRLHLIPPSRCFERREDSP